VERKALQSKFWQDVSLRSLLLCGAGVFCLFAPLGFLVDVIDAGRNTGPHLILDGLGVITGIMASYSLVMAFIATEGIRQVQMSTELTLAGEIHDTLVPPIALQGAAFEVRGRAAPASSMGGDLVDAVVVDGTLIAYVADVSGHGVPAGTLMAGLKSAARMRLLAPASITDGLTEVENRTGREFGLEGIEAVLRARGEGSLDSLLDAILAAARVHEPQRDDQTVLLVRIGR
jgi:serine phosphatase RsbU (regulator of sigma subunit)